MLKERVETLPKIEAELASLNRDYEINKAQYDTLLARRESAKISQEAEFAGDQVKFQIIEPPHVPSTPASPNRPFLNAVALFIGLGGSLAVVYLFGQFYPVVHDQKSLRELTGYPVFGSISMIRSPEMVQKHKMEMTIYISSMVGLTLLYGIIVLIQNMTR